MSWNFIAFALVRRTQSMVIFRMISMKRTFNRHLILALIVTGTCSLPGLVYAQDQSASSSASEQVEEDVAHEVRKNPYKSYLSLSYENDLIGSGKDQYYTNGVRATYFNVNTKIPRLLSKSDRLVPGVEFNETTGTYFTVGQNLYTPSDIEQRQADPNDRPWAAWLYASIGLTTLTEEHLDDVELTLGVVGPEALGEQTQKFIHRHVTDSPIPKGWSNQLDFEPGVILSWQRRWPRGIGGDWVVNFGDAFRLRAEPNVNVSLGNIYTYAGTGIMFTFGPADRT